MKKLYLFLICPLMISISLPAMATDADVSDQATVTWTGGGDGTSWSDAANWDSGLPGASDDVVISLAGANTINITLNRTVNSIAISGSNSLNLSRNLNIASASSIGTSASLNWTAGAIGGGGTLTNSGLIEISGTSLKTLQTAAIIDNMGTITLDGTGNININATSSIINNGLVEVKSGDASVDTANGNSSFVNNASGILRKSTTNDIHLFDVNLDNQGGKVDVVLGTFRFTRAPTLQGGTYDTAAGSTIELASTFTLSGSLSGNDNGQIISTSNLTIPSAASINFSNQGFYKNGGVMNGGGTLTNNEKIIFGGTALKIINAGGTTLMNSGTLYMTDTGNLNVDSGASIVNDGLLEIVSADATIDTATGNSDLVNNVSGTIRKTGDGAVHTIDVNVDNLGGTIEVVSGGLDFTRPSNFAGGTYNTGLGTTIDFGATHTFSGTLTGDDLGQIFSSATMTVPVATSFNFSNNGFEKISGIINGGGVLTNLGKFRFTGTATCTINSGASIHNDGTITMENTGNLNVDSGSSIQNDGLYEILDSGGQLDTATGNSFFNNTSTGIFRGSSGGLNTMDVDFVNAGLIDVVSGTENFTRGLDHQVGGLIQGNGTIDVTTTFTQDGDTGPGASPGILSWTGNWTPGSSSNLILDIGGPSPGSSSSNHDLLQVSGSATLGGSLTVGLFAGYVPNVGDQFTVMTCGGGCSGSFTNVISNDGVGIQVIVNPNDVVLEVTGLTQLQATVFLAGAHSTSLQGVLMDTDLNTNGLLPLTDPYGGTESVPDFSGDRADVVDWVLLEMRSDPLVPETNPQNTKVGLLKSNGDIVELDGISPLFFADGISGLYHPVVHHRNHLSIASSAALNMLPSAAPMSYSFISAGTQAFGINPMVNIMGTWAMWGGDDNGNSTVSASDFFLGWLPNNGSPTAYNPADFNMDGLFTAFDFIRVWLPANGRSSQIP